jgi:hypothetical protein
MIVEAFKETLELGLNEPNQVVVRTGCSRLHLWTWTSRHAGETLVHILLHTISLSGLSEVTRLAPFPVILDHKRDCAHSDQRHF